MRISILHLNTNMVLPPSLRHVVQLNDGNIRLTMPVGKGRCARDALPHTCNIDAFKSVNYIYTSIKRIYSESGNKFEGCNIAFDASECGNFQ